MRIAIVTLALLGCVFAHADFTIEDNGKALTVTENGQPVLVYNHAMVPAPNGVPEHYTRACYIHPLFGPGGEVLTQDFPFDHRHHRGVFWAWPESTCGDRSLDTWVMETVRQETREILAREVVDGKAVLVLANFWRYNDEPDTPIVEEKVTITVHPLSDGARAIDFDLVFVNVSAGEVVIRGSKADDKTGVVKGYGGLCFRPDATRKPMVFTAAGGTASEDVLSLETPWCDVTFPKERGGEAVSGVAIFQHPGNPGYPSDGWILRHYGFLGASWPHSDPHPLAPGESFRLRYRMFVHDGNADDAGVARAFEEYTAAAR